MAEKHGTVNILITSIDGNVTHPFRLDQTVDDVRQFGYQALVQDKGQISLSSTWIERAGTRIDNGTKLSSLVDPKKEEHGREDKPDLTLNLAWTQQGGSGR
jgi:hypothetical protein